uniref:Uncharacterized protein n=1 Tax=Aegilops tauschii subsp. strangulata TaxID=200361 RepID=A0A453B7M2_AEGTS
YSKTRGMGAGRKLKTHCRNQRWANKAYKKSHLGNEWKKPFAGSSTAGSTPGEQYMEYSCNFLQYSCSSPLRVVLHQ